MQYGLSVPQIANVVLPVCWKAEQNPSIKKKKPKIQDLTHTLNKTIPVPSLLIKDLT